MIVTFGLSISLFISIIIFAFLNHGWKFFYIFVPSNVPAALLLFLILIEILSYFIRPFSLGIRLFANLLAGHTLLNLVSSFVFFLAKIYFILFFIPMLILCAIMGLEIGVAIIQSYVFTVLTCIYITDTYSVSH
jgi:ATP synthase subunit 6